MKELSWTRKIPFFKNTYLLRSIFLAYTAAVIFTSIIVASIFILDGDGDKLGQIALPFMGIYFVLFLLFWLGAYIFMGNRYAVKYTLGQSGILIEGTKDKVKDIRALAIAAGILSSNPGVVGAGLLAREDVIQIPWNEIESIEWDENNSKLIIKCSFLKQVALHYPLELEKELNANVKYHLSQLTNIKI